MSKKLTILISFLLLVLPSVAAQSAQYTDTVSESAIGDYTAQRILDSTKPFTLSFPSTQAVLDPSTGIDYVCDVPRKVNVPYTGVTSLNVNYPSGEYDWVRISLKNQLGSEVAGGFIKKGNSFLISNLNPSNQYSFNSFGCVPKTAAPTASCEIKNGYWYQNGVKQHPETKCWVEGFSPPINALIANAFLVKLQCSRYPEPDGYTFIYGTSSGLSVFGGKSCTQDIFCPTSITSAKCPDGSMRDYDVKCNLLACPEPDDTCTYYGAKKKVGDKISSCAIGAENDITVTGITADGLCAVKVFVCTEGKETDVPEEEIPATETEDCAKDGESANFRDCCDGYKKIVKPGFSLGARICVKESELTDTGIQKCSLPAGATCTLTSVSGTDDTQVSDECLNGICVDVSGVGGRCHSETTYTLKSGIELKGHSTCLKKLEEGNEDTTGKFSRFVESIGKSVNGIFGGQPKTNITDTNMGYIVLGIVAIIVVIVLTGGKR